MSSNGTDYTLPKKGKELWIYTAWFFLFCMGYILLPKLFGGLPLKHTPPSAEPPWYFISQDFILFLGASGGFILVVLFLLAIRNRFPKQAMRMAMISTIFYALQLTRGILILTHTENLFKPDIATTIWTTQDEYLQTWFNYSICIYALLIVIVLIFRRGFLKHPATVG